MNEEKLINDLIDTIILLEYRHSNCDSIALFCAVQEGAAEMQIALIVADTSERFASKLSGPIVDDAKTCLIYAGYTIEWLQEVKLDYCLDVRKMPASQHRRLAAIARFAHLFL